MLFLVTIVMAIGSYGAYKLRERRRPAGPSVAAAGADDGTFFERVQASELEAPR